MSGISAGSACFLVRDESLLTWDGAFWKYLKKEGFKSWGVKGICGCSWVYINVNTMMFAPGVGGVPVTSSCIVSNSPDKALSIFEFKVIWEILREHKLQVEEIESC